MGQIICHENGRYNIFCTISDGFVFTSSINLEKLKEYITIKSGQDGLDKLDTRLERAHKYGNSSMFQESLRDFLLCNRAGDNEECLPYVECLKRFLS